MPIANTWGRCRVTGTFTNADGDRLGGRVTARIDHRLTSSAEGGTVVPAGVIPSASKQLQTSTDAEHSYDALLPATDDPEIQETGWTITLSVDFCGRRRTETYRVGGRDGAQLPSGGTVDLSTLVPVDSYTTGPGDPSADIPRGPEGPEGPRGPEGPPGKDGRDGLDYVPSDTDWPTVRVRPGDPVDNLDALSVGETRVYESGDNAPLAYMLDIGSASGASKTGNKVATVTTLTGPATAPATLSYTTTRTYTTTINVPTPGSIEQVAELRDGSTVRRVLFDKAAAVAAEAANPVRYPVGSVVYGWPVKSRTVTFADSVTDWNSYIRPGSFLAAYDSNSPSTEQNTSVVNGEYGVDSVSGAMLRVGTRSTPGIQSAYYRFYSSETGDRSGGRTEHHPTFGAGSGFSDSARLAVSNPPVDIYFNWAIDPRVYHVGHASSRGSAVTKHIVTVNDKRAYNIPVYVSDRCDLITWKALRVNKDGTTVPNQPVSVTGVPAAGPGWCQVICYNHDVQVVWLTQADWAASGGQQDTGWRDVTSWVVDPTGANRNALPPATVTSGKLLARRIGTTCYMATQGMITSASQLAIQLPADWWSPVLVASATTWDQTARRTLMDTAGYTRTLFHGGSAPFAVPAGSRTVIDSVSWPVTTPFPTVFPGTAVSGV